MYFWRRKNIHICGFLFLSVWPNFFSYNVGHDRKAAQYWNAQLLMRHKMATIMTSCVLVFIFRFMLFVFCALLSTKGWWLWWWRWPSSTWIVASPDSNFISKPRCCCRRVNEIIQIVQTRVNLSSFISQIICKCFLEFCEKKYSLSANTLVYARFRLLSCVCFEKKKHCKDISWSYPTISSFLLVSHEKKPFSARPYLTTGRCWFIPPLSPSSTWITHSTNSHLFCYTPLLYITQ